MSLANDIHRIRQFSSCWLAAIWLCAAQAGSGQVAAGQEAPAIKTTVNLVGVSFTARDGRGELVENLTKDDVEVLEDGKLQTIAHFAKSVDEPLTLGLIIDGSPSQEKFYREHEKDLEIFLKSVLGPKDKVFLLGFGNHLRLVNDFSGNGKDFVANLKVYEKHSERFPEIGDVEYRESGTAFYDSIYFSVREKMENENGRRALLVFSDGEDNSSSHDEMTAIEEAQRANVMVYTIRYTQPMKHGELSARNKYGIRVMDRVAKETGGSSFDATEMKPKEYFARIAEELRTSYYVGYYPKDAMKDEGFRKITIRAKTDGVKIRAKTGYFAM
jgi:Ca-activated chloride channel family protein